MISNATPDQIPAIAKLWHDGWYEAHKTIVPEALTKLRTLDSFETRAAAHLPETRIATSGGTLLGFCMIQSDELYQLYVSPAARGTGTAQALVKDAEAEIANRGHKTLARLRHRQHPHRAVLRKMRLGEYALRVH